MYTLLKFYADWCKPCQAMMPVMDQLKDDFADDIIFTDVDIENNPQVRADYHIRSIPAFVLLKDRKEVARKNGSATFGEMEAWLDEQLGNL